MGFVIWKKLRHTVATSPAFAAGTGRGALRAYEEAEGIDGSRSKQADAILNVEERALKALARFARFTLVADVVGAHQVKPVLVYGEESDLVSPDVVDAFPRQE